MSKQITFEQRLTIWNGVLQSLLDDWNQKSAVFKKPVTNGICLHLMNEHNALFGETHSKPTEIMHLYPELIKRCPRKATIHSYWYKQTQIAVRINLIDKIINELKNGNQKV